MHVAVGQRLVQQRVDVAVVGAGQTVPRALYQHIDGRCVVGAVVVRLAVVALHVQQLSCMPQRVLRCSGFA